MRRRNIIPGMLLSTALCALFAPAGAAKTTSFDASWSNVPDRVWVGPQFWANRLQDWRVAGGRLECVEGRPAKPMRTVHVLTHTLEENPGLLIFQVRLGLLKDFGKSVPDSSAAGFLIGAGRDLDYRAAALIHHSQGPNAGIFAGINAKGALFFRDFSTGKDLDFREAATAEPRGSATPKDVKLWLIGAPKGETCALVLTARDSETDRELRSAIVEGLEPARLVGSIALVSHPGSGKGSGRFWFNDLEISGSRVRAHEGRECGPILSTQYTLSRNVLKLTAQLMPLGKKDNQTVALQVRKGFLGRKWKTIATAEVISPGWTATFRVGDWDSTKDTDFRVVYDLETTDGEKKEYTWSGTIRHDPVQKKEIVVAAFTGNHNVQRGVDGGKFSWTEDHMWFPHNEIVAHVSAHKPDLLFFSGDNVYEGASPTAPDRSGEESSYYDYLYKWYLWCWAFRDLAREIPCVAIPDDHDVFQGNVWGAGGRKTDKDDKGGYIMPADWVKMVDRTQTSNLPDPYDPTPIEQGIGVYYTALNWGRISFAVLEDRKFKSGPNGLCPPTTSNRADHVIDPNFDPKTADVPGAKLLGNRQLAFLRDWAADWSGVDMKAALSQTVFAGLATHHGANLMYLVADYDSNGWPQTGRNKALREFRRGFAFMIGGDQHLATLVHHGVDDWNDAGWSFAVPSIANFYPRAWRPKVPGKNRQEGLPDYTGEYRDGLGNHVTVWAATNPGQSMGHEPAALHDRMPGYGIIRFNKKDRSITAECWPRFADPKKDKQYLGWPRTIDQLDNYGRRPAAYLPAIHVKGLRDPVVQIIDETDGEIVYTLRIQGDTFRPKVFRMGPYTIKVGEPDEGKSKTMRHVQSLPEGKSETLLVEF